MLVIDRRIKPASSNTLNHYAKCIFHPCRLQKHTLNKWQQLKKPNYDPKPHSFLQKAFQTGSHWRVMAVLPALSRKTVNTQFSFGK